MKILEGKVVAQGTKIGIVASRFNEFIVSKLIGGAQDALIRHGVADNDITLAWVPGAFEIPLTAQKMAKTSTMMQLSAWALSSGEPPAIMTMYAQRSARGLPPLASRQRSLSSSALSPQTTSSRPLNALAQKPATKDMTPPAQPSKW